MLIKRTKERSQEITPDNRGVIWGKELNGMATDEELYGQYLSNDLHRTYFYNFILFRRKYLLNE